MEKGEKSRHALLSEGNNSLHTHFFLPPPLFPSGPFLIPHLPPPVLLFYALNHQQQRCRTELKHRMCWIYRIRHDPAPLPRSVPFPIHTRLLFRSPSLFPWRSHSCFPLLLPLSCCPCALNLLRGEQRGGTRVVS